MAGGKLSPRQKMINMMYLVLTALLALNVSKEILDAFVIVNEGMLMQKTNIERSNNRMWSDFEQQKMLYKNGWETSNKKVYYERAQKVRVLSDEMVKYIEDMKTDLIAMAEGIKREEVISKKMTAKDVTKMDNYDIPTTFFGTNDPANPPAGRGKAAELRKKLAEYRTKLLSKEFLDKSEDTSRIKLNLDTENPVDWKTGKEKGWEMFYFYHLPMPAALTELTKWQNNVRGAETALLGYLYDKFGSSSFKFDAVKAAIIPKSNVVFSGSTFEADIFLAAYNTTQRPEIIANGTRVTEFTPDGRAIYKIQASGEGEKTVTGVIRVQDLITQEIKEEPFEVKYQVAKPMMTVSPDKMNVFYRGLENPVSISVPGVAPNQIKASCTGCASFSGTNGHYTVKPGTGNEANINVTVTTADGQSKNMGSARFRIKRIPDPTIKFSGKKSNDVLSIVEATSGGALIPLLEDFDFEVYAVIKEFTVSFDNGSGSIYDKKCYGNQIPSDVANMMKRIPKGKKLYFDGIKVSMPDGTIRNSTAVYTIR